MGVAEARDAAIDPLSLLDVGTDRLGEDRLGHLQGNEISAEPGASSLGPDDLERGLQPWAGLFAITAQMYERREPIEKNVPRPLGQSEVPADELRIAGTLVTTPNQRSMTRESRP